MSAGAQNCQWDLWSWNLSIPPESSQQFYKLQTSLSPGVGWNMGNKGKEDPVIHMPEATDIKSRF